MLNLILAMIWGLFGAWAIGFSTRPLLFPGTEIPVGWLALALCVYNLVRWWTTRARARDHVPLQTLPRRHDYDEEPPP